ncbi:MAG TPA: DJ-1 family glyoxalase III [Gammaproteobacteria bacterium]|nr:DJ-1 family glyoxalase III [Gammaproteobacteria bacterium]
MPKVLVPLAQGCEELEAVTIIDLLRRAGIEVITAGLDKQPVRASRGVILVADTDIDSALQEDFDMVVLPGGKAGAEQLDNDPRIKQLLKKMANDEKYTAAICAAPTVLAHAGLLDGKQATSYPGFLEKMPLTNTRISNSAVVVDGNVITSRGPGTAMDFALTLIESLAGQDKRIEVETALVRN